MPPAASTAAAHSCPRRQPSSRSVVRSTGAASILPCDAPDAALASSQVHARNKPLDRSNDDALLRQIADLAIGYSGAELANLMNESAILAVSCCFLLCQSWGLPADVDPACNGWTLPSGCKFASQVLLRLPSGRLVSAACLPC